MEAFSTLPTICASAALAIYGIFRASLPYDVLEWNVDVSVLLLGGEVNVCVLPRFRRFPKQLKMNEYRRGHYNTVQFNTILKTATQNID